MKIDNTVHENEVYFDVQQAKQLLEDFKLPADKIKTVSINGRFKDDIKAEDIELMTEFDKNIKQFYNFSKK